LCLALLAAQEPHRIIEIGVEEPMVLDHGAHGRIADQRGAEAAEPKAAAVAPIRQIERYGRIEQQFRRVGREIQRFGDGRGRLWSRGEKVEKPEPHARVKNLRINEARAQIEECTSPPSRRAPREWKRGGPALEAWVTEPPVPDRRISISPWHDTTL